jgi:UDP-3-O-[3-hydroxymyristoyl] glucosamine N-acyltransferase
MKLSKLAQALSAELRLSGPDPEITGVSSSTAATPTTLVFAEDAAALSDALASPAAAVIVSPKMSDLMSDNVRQASDTRHPPSDKSLLIVPQPRLAFAQAARLLKPAEPATGIHPTAVVDPTATLGERVSVGPHAVIEAGAQIGSGTSIGAGTIIGTKAKIGAHCSIYPRVVLYPGTEIGNNCVLHAGVVLGSDGFGYVRDAKTGEYLQFPQQGRLILEDNVEIGANTTIDRGALEETRIERGVKIDNLVHLGHNVRVGHDVVIAAQTGVSGSSSIGANAIVGGQVGIGDHAHIGEQVILGSGSGVLTSKKVKGPGIVFWGRPARPLRQYLKELAALARLARSSKDEEEH